MVRSGSDQFGSAMWRCDCECGKTITVRAGSLIRGNTRSCGCYQIAQTKQSNTTHGGCGSPTYRVWHGMIQRCTNPKNISYPYYGAIGITVCERWFRFENFLADMGERPEGTTLDRKDNLKGYVPSNCRWATSKDQSVNRRHVKLVTLNGKTQSLSDWARELPIPRTTLYRKVKQGVPLESLI